MTPIEAVFSFTLVAGLLTVTPGLDTALILRSAIVGAPRYAWGTVFGIQAGTLVWGLAASLGISVILLASQLAYDILRAAGAAYLLYVGLRMVWSTRRAANRSDSPTQNSSAEMQRRGFAWGWRRGVLTNLLNPKVGAFYVALLPQFLPEGQPSALFGAALAGIHVALGLAWSTVLLLAARRVRGILERPFAQRLLDRVTGTIIAAFGARLALSSTH